MVESKALINRKEICTYLRIGKNVFYSLVKEGLLVKRVGGRWVGHKDELDDFFRVRSELSGSFPEDSRV
jgi:hypothetical protein